MKKIKIKINHSRFVFLFFFLLQEYYVAQTDTTPPITPQGFTSYSYELHINLTWQPNNESDLAGYKIYKWNGSQFVLISTISKERNFYWEWIGTTSISGKYKISAFDFLNNESPLSNEVTTLTHIMSDNEFLDMTQRATFRYFWDYGDPNSGLARERWDGGKDLTNTIGGSGFGLMAILVGIERGFITRDQGILRFIKILNFLTNTAEKFHGVFPHWLNGNTGKVVKFGIQDGGDLVETAFLIQGLLTARQYFDKQNGQEEFIRNSITQIWQNVDWDFYRNGSSGLYWNWSPTMGFNFSDTFIFHGWNETLIAYILAISSPTHSVFPSIYRSGWANNGNIKYTGQQRYGYDLYLGKNNSMGGPLFFTHYSFLGFDPRGIRDLYANYFNHNKNQSLVNREYCIANPKNMNGYGQNCWGLTASYSIPGVGYTAHEPLLNDNGTITPTAALSSMPYTPQESLSALKHFYRNYGAKLWGDFGFKDAFNLTYSRSGVSGEWFSDGYLAIDQGPIICMIENYRSELLWKYFMKDPDVKSGLEKIPFFQDPTDVHDEHSTISDFNLYGNYPNPFNSSTTISFSISRNQNTKIIIYNSLGQIVRKLVDREISSGEHLISWDGTDEYNRTVSSGAYFYSIQSNTRKQIGKMVLIK
jgi:hypothetical protein